MKRIARLTTPLALLVALAGPAGSDPAPQPPLSFSPGVQGTFNAEWQGVSGRTYFMQWSLDLETWQYAPFIDFGDGEHDRGLDSTSDMFFTRLHYGDFDNITSLDEAMNGDIDGDGLSNIFEVTYGYDPFHSTSTMDGPDASLDPDQDGVGNANEQAHGTDPMVKDNPKLQLEVIEE